MSETPEVNPANLPHQVEEADRFSMIAAFRVVGLLVVACALVQLICGMIGLKSLESVVLLNHSPKWNGVAGIFLLGACVFFVPGPTAVRLGTPKLRAFVRLFLAALSALYLVLAGLLTQATFQRMEQLEESDLAGQAKREVVFRNFIRQIETSPNRQILDSLFVSQENAKPPFKASEELGEYRRQVSAHFEKENTATVAGLKIQFREQIDAAQVNYLRKIIRSTLFGLAFLALALAAPRGFPQPLPAHEQPA